MGGVTNYIYKKIQDHHDLSPNDRNPRIDQTHGAHHNRGATDVGDLVPSMAGLVTPTGRCGLMVFDPSEKFLWSFAKS